MYTRGCTPHPKFGKPSTSDQHFAVCKVGSFRPAGEKNLLSVHHEPALLLAADSAANKAEKVPALLEGGRVRRGGSDVSSAITRPRGRGDLLL